MKRLLIAIVLAAGCKTGGLQERCNRDGTCDYPALACTQALFGGFYCFLREEKEVDGGVR